MNFAITAQIKNIKVKYLLLLLFLTMLCMIILGLKLGFISLAWTEIVKILLIKAGILQATDISSDLVDVVWMLRMPRIILAACVGMGLTLSGIIMQAVVKNPLADPYILGVSSGASLGATCAIFLGLGAFLGAQAIGICAFIGAFAISLLVTYIADNSRSKSASNLLLAGMAVSAICASLSSLIAFVGRNKEGMEAITYWLMGNVANAKLGNVLILAVVVVCLAGYFMTQTRILNLMLTGYDSAMTLKRYIRRYLLLNGLLVGFIVFNSGTIGFIGLLIPHFVRLIFGSNHKKLLPVAVAFGGLVTVVMDILSRTLINGIDIPLGVVFSLIGAPCFIYMMLKQNYRFGAK